MRRSTLLFLALLALPLTSACDKGKPAEGEKKSADADAQKDPGEVKPEQAKPEEAKPEQAEPEAKHFDIEADKSGVLARTASVIETTDQTSTNPELREHLAALSHHAENISSDETLCQHIIELRKAEDQPQGELDSCVLHFEHQIVILGPEVFAQMAQCIKDAKSIAEIEVCEEAEKEAEKLLHENKHGDGLSPEQCEELFTKFETITVADAGEDGEMVKSLLQGVKADVLTACADQATKAEYECAMKASDMEALTGCQSVI